MSTVKFTACVNDRRGGDGVMAHLDTALDRGSMTRSVVVGQSVLEFFKTLEGSSLLRVGVVLPEWPSLQHSTSAMRQNDFEL